jgi:hypothetical protein
MARLKITDVPGIGAVTAERLATGGIRTVSALAKAAPEKIDAIPGFGPARTAAVKAAVAQLVGESAAASEPRTKATRKAAKKDKPKKVKKTAKKDKPKKAKKTAKKDKPKKAKKTAKKDKPKKPKSGRKKKARG